jgi:hypothetical protein
VFFVSWLPSVAARKGGFSNTAQPYNPPLDWEWTTTGPDAEVIHNLPLNPLFTGFTS